MKIEASELSEIERDALAEIANMGVSRAATSLRQMVGEQVLLSVPAVNIVTRQSGRQARRTERLSKVGCGAAIVRRAVFRAGAA